MNPNPGGPVRRITRTEHYAGRALDWADRHPDLTSGLMGLVLAGGGILLGKMIAHVNLWLAGY